MVQMKYNELNNMQFITALQRLAQRPLPVKAAYNVKKWADVIQRARATISAEYSKEVLGTFAEKNEDGTVKLKNPSDASSYTVPEDQMEGFTKVHDEFGERTFNLERRKILLEDLGNIDISAAEIAGLEPILTTLEEETMAREHLKAVPGGSVQ